MQPAVCANHMDLCASTECMYAALLHHSCRWSRAEGLKHAALQVVSDLEWGPEFSLPRNSDVPCGFIKEPFVRRVLCCKVGSCLTGCSTSLHICLPFQEWASLHPAAGRCRQRAAGPFCRCRNRRLLLCLSLHLVAVLPLAMPNCC